VSAWKRGRLYFASGFGPLSGLAWSGWIRRDEHRVYYRPDDRELPALGLVSGANFIEVPTDCCVIVWDGPGNWLLDEPAEPPKPEGPDVRRLSEGQVPEKP